LRAGADLVCFSLDKLFGGPQGGVVTGKARYLADLRRDPLARALRVGKLTLAALEPVIDAYVHGHTGEIVVHALLATPVEELKLRVERWRESLGELAQGTRVVETEAAIGGGALAEAPVQSAALRIERRSVNAVAETLRRQTPPVIGRIADDALLIDARTVRPDEDEALVLALRSVLGAYPPSV
jgi:L-seryl-tRNA(Ser) seleniumtransferase